MPPNVFAPSQFDSIDQFLPNDMRGRPKQSYAYQAIFVGATVLAAGGVVAVTTSIDNDSNFLVRGVNAVVRDPTQLVAVAVVPISIQIQYTGAGSTFFQQSDHLNNVAGTAQEPGWLSYPFLVPGGATLVTTLTNLDPATAFTVRLSYFGAKVFRGR